MDRFVWLIAITVISHLIIDISSVTASDKDSTTTRITDKHETRINIEDAEQVEEVEPLVPLRPGNKQNANGRNTILDNIFNIPIVTLRAVNELVQSIAGNLQAAGAGTYFNSERSRIQHEHKVVLGTQSTPASTPAASSAASSSAPSSSRYQSQTQSTAGRIDI